MWPFPRCTLSQIPLGLAELLALCGIHINCVNILVVLFWCIYWLLDYMRVYLAVCCPARERGERVQASWSAGIVGAFRGCASLLWCAVSHRQKQNRRRLFPNPTPPLLTESNDVDDERWGWRWSCCCWRWSNTILHITHGCEIQSVATLLGTPVQSIGM